MKRIATLLWLLSFAAASTSAYASPNGKDSHNPEQRNIHIEQYIKKICGNDTTCTQEKRADYEKRMSSYKQYVKDRCGEDASCQQAIRSQYMARRAKREARIAKHCGDDKACGDKLREEYGLHMQKGREKCGQDKECWHQFYKNKPE